MITIKRTYISENQPPVTSGLWLKPTNGGFVLYLIEGGSITPLKLADDKGTETTADDQVHSEVYVTDITGMTGAQLDSLNVGDKVIKKTGKQNHLYTVTYKGSGVGEGICITYQAAGLIETVSYDYTVDGWVYNSTDKCTIALDD